MDKEAATGDFVKRTARHAAKLGGHSLCRVLPEPGRPGRRTCVGGERIRAQGKQSPSIRLGSASGFGSVLHREESIPVHLGTARMPGIRAANKPYPHKSPGKIGSRLSAHLRRFGNLYALNRCYVPSRRRPRFVVCCSFCAISSVAGDLARNETYKEWHFF